ncbi:hypothetical protein [Actinoplanes couchii]|uniref:Uncharacterized protein n=1 Tax=Actinoplanes couchii TaxID=403638 RepID=A0ABQ3X1Z0_9ACTN|nr:hypothetical protein [Actinoplanes couchii]MDR6316928.1 hypothetical protein [Actinoplanes couchii]GID52535.1 hypothetical protein Aco03nite_009390 [Actinoplanes couchii]
MSSWGEQGQPPAGSYPPFDRCRRCGGRESDVWAGHQGTWRLWQLAWTPRGQVWQCVRCFAVADLDDSAYDFDPRVPPAGRDQGLAAIRVLQRIILGLRHSQEGPVDPEDLYELCRPYFHSGWCVRDVIHALNQTPEGTPHPDTGWADRLPRKQLLYRVLRRLREWRWADRDQDDDIMPGGWAEMRRAMQALAERQQNHAKARDEGWAQRLRESQAGPGLGREEARRAARAATAQQRVVRAQSERQERAEQARTAQQARDQRQDQLTGLADLDRRLTDDDRW